MIGSISAACCPSAAETLRDTLGMEGPPPRAGAGGGDSGRRLDMDSSAPIDDADGLSLASRHCTGAQHFGANAYAELFA